MDEQNYERAQFVASQGSVPEIRLPDSGSTACGVLFQYCKAIPQYQDVARRALGSLAAFLGSYRTCSGLPRVFHSSINISEVVEGPCNFRVRFLVSVDHSSHFQALFVHL